MAHTSLPHDPLGSLERGIEILMCLTGPPLDMARIRKLTGLPRTTAYRLLAILRDGGLIRSSGDGYELGGHLAALMATYQSRMRGNRRDVLPHVLSLYESTRQTVNVGVPQGLAVRYTERIYGQNRTSSRSDGVDTAPLHCTAIGKVLLAFDPGLQRDMLGSGPLPQLARRTITRRAVLERELALIRNEGVAYAQEEFDEGLMCAAAPVFGPGGECRMAIGVASPVRGTPLSRLGPAVALAARLASDTLAAS